MDAGAQDEEFARHPDISPTLYLVDEEAIGRDPGAVSRILAVAAALTRAGFKWGSCRIDQIVHPGQDRAWHVDSVVVRRGPLTGRRPSGARHSCAHTPRRARVRPGRRRD
ncbi:hypothetical protein [Nonomuraea lactucae]|uniref:hypothetical protein n=1 Tax=Nonomuraea lactucae TaxID=2249762 RepID=UPI0013B40B54|nr:hypothetical protein [Nonomuraea lactucae]